MNGRINLAFYACLYAASALLAAGFGLAQRWPGLALAVLVGVGWLAARRLSWNWLINALLGAFTALSAASLLSGVSPALAIAASAAALAAWELSAQENPPRDEPARALAVGYLRARRVWLAAAVGLGLLLAEAGLFLRFAMPFGVLLLAALLVLFGFYQFYRYSRKP